MNIPIIILSIIGLLVSIWGAIAVCKQDQFYFILFCGFCAMFGLSLCLGIVTKNTTEAYEKVCRENGGVPRRIHDGRICISKEFVIEVDEASL